jgi:hypothetical protein
MLWSCMGHFGGCQSLSLGNRLANRPQASHHLSILMNDPGQNERRDRCINAIGFSSKRVCLLAPNVGKFARHGNKAGDRNGFRTPRGIDMCGRRQPRRIDRHRL